MRKSRLFFKRCAFPTSTDGVKTTYFGLHKAYVSEKQLPATSFVVGHWDKYTLVALPSDSQGKEKVPTHKIFFFTQTGHDHTRTLEVDTNAKTMLFGGHFLLNLSPDGSGIVWNLKSYSYGAAVQISSRHHRAKPSLSEQPLLMSACDQMLYVIKDQLLSQLSMSPKRDSTVTKLLLSNLAENFARNRSDYSILSFDVASGPSKKMALLCKNSNGQSYVYVGDLPQEEKQSIDELGDWFPIEGNPSEVKLAAGHILLFGHNKGDHYPKTIKIQKLVIGATVTLADVSEIRHGISGIKDLASYVPSFVPSFLKSAVDAASSYCQHSIQGYSFFCSKEFGNIPYILSFNDSIRVFTFDGTEVNLGHHFLGQGLKQHLKSADTDAPITVAGIHALSESNQLVVFWNQTVRREIHHNVSFLELQKPPSSL